MFTLTVRDRMMIAHSLDHPGFGPARNLHGCTYVVETTWHRPTLDDMGVVMDIGEATEQLHAVLADLDYKNLDELDIFAGRLTTTEFLAQHIAEQLRTRIDTGPFAALEVTLREHPDAWASYRLEF
ncbi:6-pyruvoyl trahydropterin synthase family protein [Granulicoccus sp. GXG6511]|uniref:6-pyruvoyl trahydropterin synthase family protein n=1 Tax=Granulicoccus sp. GXG6511 TaxID=3381351 RepID=UPI003D7CD3BF